MHRVRSVEEAYKLALKAQEKESDNWLKGIGEQGGVHHLPHVEDLTLLKVNHPKKQMIIDKVTQTNYEEEYFRWVEVMEVSEV